MLVPKVNHIPNFTKKNGTATKSHFFSVELYYLLLYTFIIVNMSYLLKYPGKVRFLLNESIRIWNNI